MMLPKTFTIIYFAFTFCTAQNLDSLLNHFAADKRQQIIKIQKDLDDKKDLKWLNLLPNFNYNIANNSFNVGVNLNSFTSYFQQKKRNEIERKRLILQEVNALNNQITAFQNAIEKYKVDSISAYSNANSIAIWQEMHAIKREQHKRNQLTLENFNAFLLRYNSALNSYQSRINSNILQRKILVNNILNSKKSANDQFPNTKN